jgi:hypothetical protein
MPKLLLSDTDAWCRDCRRVTTPKMKRHPGAKVAFFRIPMKKTTTASALVSSYPWFEKQLGDSIVGTTRMPTGQGKTARKSARSGR